MEVPLQPNQNPIPLKGPLFNAEFPAKEGALSESNPLTGEKLPGFQFKPFRVSIDPDLYSSIIKDIQGFYGDVRTWDGEKWNLMASRVAEQLNKIEWSTFEVMRRSELETNQIAPDWLRPWITDFHIRKLRMAAVILEYAEISGFIAEPLRRNLPGYWWHSEMRSMVPELETIYKYFTGRECEAAPAPERFSFEASACIEAMCAQFEYFVESRGVTNDEKRRWNIIASRIEDGLVDRITGSSAPDCHRVLSCTGNLLARLYHTETNTMETLAATVARNSFLMSEESLSQHEHEPRLASNTRDGEDSEAQSDWAGIQRRMLDSMITAFTESFLREHRSGPHRDAGGFLEKVRASVCPDHQNCLPTLTEARDRLLFAPTLSVWDLMVLDFGDEN